LTIEAGQLPRTPQGHTQHVPSKIAITSPFMTDAVEKGLVIREEL
jgi:hypothetical protein